MKLHPNIQNDQWQEVLEHFNDKESILSMFHENVEELPLPYLNRLNKWFAFFNENYTFSISIYTTTIKALLEAVTNNQHFRTQTTHEFDLSLSFYKILFDSKIFLKIDHVSDAKLLLSISLIFGKFPGLLRYSIPKSVGLLSEGITKAKLEQFFTQLFVKYENPFFFIENMNLLTANEIEAMMFLLQGNNLSRFEKLPFKISKKESFIIVNKIPTNFEIKDNVMLRIVIASKLLLNNSDNNKYLVRFLCYSKTFEHRVEIFYDDIKFWIKAFMLYCDIMEKYNSTEDGDIIDFFEYHKYHSGTNYNLKEKTTDGLLHDIRQWHYAGVYYDQLELMKKNWKGTQKETFKINTETDDYLFEEITNGIDLYKESQTLKHCVFSYIRSCIDGETTIWSMKKREDDKFKNYITIEVVKNKVVQVRGKYNKEIEEYEYPILKKWANKFNFELEWELV